MEAVRSPGPRMHGCYLQNIFLILYVAKHFYEYYFRYVSAWSQAIWLIVYKIK